MKNESSGTARICVHDIEWWYDVSDNPFPIDELPECEEEHIRQEICREISQGELCYSDQLSNGQDFTWYGWWKIQNK